MQAIEGPVTHFIKNLDIKYFVNKKRLLGGKLHMNDRRSTTFHVLAQFLWMVDKWPDRRSSCPTARELHDWLIKSGEPSDSLRRRAHEVLKFFLELVNDEGHLQRLLRTEVFAPVEFIFSSLLIALHNKQLKLEGVARAIWLMRWEVRLMFPGQVRINRVCCSVMSDFIIDLTKAKMDWKEGELIVMQRLKEEEMERQKEDRRRLKLGPSFRELEEDDEAEDDNAEIDFTIPESPSKKRKIEN
jgi:hypothetical protein